MHVIKARHHAQLFGGEMQKRAFTVGAEGELAWIGLAVIDQLLHGFEGCFGADHQGHKVGGHHGHGREVFARIVGHFGIGQGHDDHVAALAAAQGVAIGSRLFQKR